MKTHTIRLTSAAKSPKKAKVVSTPTPAPAPVVVPEPHKAAVLVTPTTMVGKIYAKLVVGEPVTTAELFKDLGSSDPNQLITDLRRIGRKHGEFVINRVGAGTYQLVPSAK